MTNLALNNRGRHILQHIVDRFFYLQLVVDDFMLPLPRECFEEFMIGDKEMDYRYVVSGENDYHEKSRMVVRIKARRVLFFLEILSVSFDLEREAFAAVFRRLASEGVKIPSMSEISLGVLDEIKRLKLIDEQTLLSYQTAARGMREKLKAQLRNVYELSHRKPSGKPQPWRGIAYV